MLSRLVGRAITVRYGDWRPGDQPVYISDITLARQELDWYPKISVGEGVSRMVGWIRDHLALFR